MKGRVVEGRWQRVRRSREAPSSHESRWGRTRGLFGGERIERISF
jgi:hypothetical protein